MRRLWKCATQGGLAGSLAPARPLHPPGCRLLLSMRSTGTQHRGQQFAHRDLMLLVGTPSVALCLRIRHAKKIHEQVRGLRLGPWNVAIVGSVSADQRRKIRSPR